MKNYSILCFYCECSLCLVDMFLFVILIKREVIMFDPSPNECFEF
jgi:hypothetical protein